ncbi:MAG TPA: hypothetical protein VGH69_21430 [Mycobacterium sp.]
MGTAIHYSRAGQVADVVSQASGASIGGCIGGSAVGGIALTGSICYYATPSGQDGITLTGRGGGGGPLGANLMLGASISDAQSLCDLHGPFAYAGATFGEGFPEVGAQGAFGTGSNGKPVGGFTAGWTLGVNFPTPFIFEAGVTDTGIFPAW